MEGNQMKMREALRACFDFIMRLDRAFNPFMQNLLEKAIAKAQAALSAPPRNCDVGTAEEQVRRHCSMCVTITRNGTKGCDYSKCNSCFAKWAQMPYEAEEGGAK